MSNSQKNIYPYTFIYKGKRHTLLWESDSKGDKFLTKNVILLLTDIKSLIL